jgi:hypothetical protein
LSNLTPSCTKQAQDSIEVGASSGPGVWQLYFYDEESVHASKAEIATTAFSDMTVSGIELLLEAGFYKRRTFSASAIRKAERIMDEEKATVRYRTLTPVSANTKVDDPEFVCFSDTCPQGTTCQALDLTRTGNVFLKDLPNQARLYKKIIRWARGAGVSKAEVRNLRAKYAQNFKVFNLTVRELQGTTIYVSRGGATKK